MRLTHVSSVTLNLNYNSFCGLLASPEHNRKVIVMQGTAISLIQLISGDSRVHAGSGHGPFRGISVLFN